MIVSSNPFYLQQKLKQFTMVYKIFLDFFFCNSPDTWFLTTTQALQWITDPKPLSQLTNYEPWACQKHQTNVQAPCNLSNKCALPFKTQTSNITDTRYMETCRECPVQYPWLGDAGGTGIVNKDDYIDNGSSDSERSDEYRKK